LNWSFEAMANRKERAHNEGTDFTRESTSEGGVKGAFDAVVEMADKAVEEVGSLAKTATQVDNMPKVVAGATLGMFGAMVVPFVSVPLGILAGAGYVAHRLRKAQDGE
jgi:hypothetical protein